MARFVTFLLSLVALFVSTNAFAPQPAFRTAGKMLDERGNQRPIGVEFEFVLLRYGLDVTRFLFG
jgi:hypothetical protein